MKERARSGETATAYPSLIPISFYLYRSNGYYGQATRVFQLILLCKGHRQCSLDVSPVFSLINPPCTKLSAQIGDFLI